MQVGAGGVLQANVWLE
jgi:hypothetical protein